RGAAHGRGAPPADAAVGRPLWAAPAQPERRADPAGGAVEIWLQVDQEHRRHRLCRAPAADQLEQGGAAGIWLLFQRQSGRRSSALEPGAGTADRRISQAADADVQRLWIGGCLDVRRHEPEALLLMTPPRWLKPLLFILLLVPMAGLGVAWLQLI